MAKKKFGFFDVTKEGEGVKKESYVEDKPFTLSTFFKTLGRNFWNFSGLNFLYIVINLPIFFGLYALSGNLNFTSQTPLNPLYSQLFGITHAATEASPITQLHFSKLYEEYSLSLPSTATIVFFFITLLVVFTFGITNCGMAAVLRGYTRKEPVFLASDFFGSIAANWKQALPMGIIDVVATFVTFYVFNFWRTYAQGFVNDIMFYLSIFLLVIYFFMRFYIYTLMITFDLSIYKILKNSFIFALLGFKRNFVALLGILLTVFINFYIFALFMPLGIILPFIITISLCSFIAIYCTYPNVKKFMIDPYYSEKDDDSDDEEDPIFVDRG